MKSIILSCTPAECEKIVNGDMSILVRKKVPKETPFKVYIYCAKSDKYLLDRDSDGSMFCWDKKEHHYPFKYEKDHEELFNGKVISSFVCDKIYHIKGEYTDGGSAERRHKSIETFLSGEAHNELLFATCLEIEELFDYLGNGKWGYGLHITALKIYDKPRELSEFKKADCDCPFPYVYMPPCPNCDERDINSPPKNYIYVEEQENSNE